MNFIIKTMLVIFLVHIFFTGLISALVVGNYIIDQHSEAHILWIIYGHVTTFPFLWLWSPVLELLYPPVSPFSNVHLNYLWNAVITPWILYLPIGWVNSCIIFLPFLLIRRAFWNKPAPPQWYARWLDVSIPTIPERPRVVNGGLLLVFCCFVSLPASAYSVISIFLPMMAGMWVLHYPVRRV
jgi:hypothetical protein